MKRSLALLLLPVMLLCAAGCDAGAGEPASPALAITAVMAEDLAQTLEKLSEGAKSQPALIGYPVRPGYLADLDSDGTYELYANLCFGSGIVDERVQCYDPATDQTSILSDRAVTDYVAVAYENALYIIAHPYNGSEATVFRAVLSGGALACEDIDPELQKEILDAQAG